MELEKDKENISKDDMSDEKIKAKLEHTRKSLGFTEEQMDIFIQKAKQKGKDSHSHFQDIEDDLELTLTQKLNLLVYGSFIVATIYILNRDYDSVVTLWLIKMFPRESRTLGLHLFLGGK